MNAVVKFDDSVPAFLRNAGFLALNTKASAGLSQGAPPRISFKGSRFHFISADGAVTHLPDAGAAGANSLTLDVIVVDASEHVSKFYYDKAYDPNAEDLSPACFSDNGKGPSSRAQNPQSLLCANCPKNAWGSKITPQGTQVKACSDVKKIACVPVSNIDGPVYMLGIPAASLKTWSAAVNAVTSRGIPIPALVIRLGFEPGAEYPKLTFNPTRYISQEEANSIQDLFGSDETANLVGRNDTAIEALPAPAAPAAAQPIQMPQAPAAAPIFAMPQAAPAPAQAAPAPRRRGRPAGTGSAAPVGQTQQAAPAAPAQPTPAAPPAAPFPAAAPVVQAAPSNIDALLDSVLGKPAGA